MSDLISREEALMALTGANLPTDRDKLIALFDKRIKALPTVDREESVLKALEEVKAEIEALYDGNLCAKLHNCDKDVLDIITQKITEVKKNE